LAVVSHGLVRAEDADALVKQGIQLRKQGKDRDAYDVFQRAVAIQNTPRNLAQLGLCEQSLGLWPKAEAHIKKALGTGEDPWIKKNRATLAESLRTLDAHLGSLDVWGDPAGAEVLFNGTSVGTLPDTGPVRFETGQVTFTVRAKGYVDATRTVELKSGDSLRENVVLLAVSRPAVAATTTEGTTLALKTPPPDSNDSTASLVAQPASESADEHPLYTRWWFWTAIGAVVAGGVVTAIMLHHSSSSSPCDANTTCSTWGS
jgi:hypothetical protein